MQSKIRNLKICSKAVDIVTILWLLHFIMNLFTNLLNETYSVFFLYFIYTFFVTDLIIIFINHNSKKKFFKENWFDILMILPLFRLFRFLRILKINKLRNLLKLLKKSKKLKSGKKIVSESFDLGRQINDRVTK